MTRSSPAATDPLERLRHELLALSPDEFEEVALIAIASMVGSPLRRAVRGRQPVGDGSGGSIAVEAKRYGAGVPPTRDLLGGLAGTAAAHGGLTHWVVATTAALPQQAVQEIERDADLRQIRFLPLDWPKAGLAPLAAVVIGARRDVSAAFPQLAESLAALADHPQAAASFAEITEKLSAEPAGWPIHDPVLSWRQGLGLTTLLDAKYRIVPLMNREADLAEWVRWAQHGPSWARVMTGDGGMGKTRLMIELCHRLKPLGWRAGFLRNQAHLLDQPRLARQIATPGRRLIVVDYAELRQDELEALCRMVLECGALDRLRLVLLARNAGPWLSDLKENGGAVGQVLGGSGCEEPIRLTPAAPIKRARRQRDRAAVLVAATTAFGTVAGVDGPAIGADLAHRLPLEKPEFDRILLLLAEGWLEIFADGKQNRTAGGWAAILEREKRYLSTVTSAIKPAIKPKTVMQALAWVSYHDGAASKPEALKLLARCDALVGHGSEAILALAELFHDLYPGANWLNPLQPDLLSSALLDAYSP